MNDSEIRRLLFSSTLSAAKDDENTRIVQELAVCDGRARIDIALVNGLLVGYEIKSDRDNLARLEDQIYYYDKVFQKLSIITGTIHLSKLEKFLPDHWGIMVVSKSRLFPIEIIQEPRLNPNVSAKEVLKLLWKDELYQFLCNIQAKAPKSFTKAQLMNLIVDQAEPEFIFSRVRSYLRARNAWRSSQPPRLNGGSHRRSARLLSSLDLPL